MRVTRRTFLKASAATTGTLLASRYLFGELETLKAGQAPAAQPTEEWVLTTCWIGKQDCGVLARRIGGRVVKLEGNPARPRNRGTLCPKGVAQISALYDPNRVKTPLIRTNEKGVPGQWRRATWDEALRLVADRIREVRARNRSWWSGRKGAARQVPSTTPPS